MCGIAGAVGYDLATGAAAVGAMCDQMHARGPDDRGVETLPGGHSVGVCRLAIIDPSPAGHQPMSDADRGTTIAFNGMIYNFRDLRARLEADGERFGSDCDTEVVLRAYGRYGPECVRELRGMFAFAIWDAPRGRLFVARDRLGIKPFYYAHRDGSLLFASHVRALLATGRVEPRISGAGLRTYLAYGAVSEPLTAIEGVLALPAAHAATFGGGRFDVWRYWTPPEEADEPVEREDAVEELRSLLDDTVRRHLVSDAPLGIFLSGGLDSSTLAAMAARHTRRVRTVSVFFDDPELSERPYMDLVAERIESEHVRVDLRPADLLGWLDDAFAAMDQPTFDGINSYVVSRAAHGTGLKVALSGLGADELFDGYGYVGRMAALERLRRLPQPVTRVAARALAVGVGGGRGEKVREWLGGEAERGTSYELLRRLFLPDEVRQLARGGSSRNGLPRPQPLEDGRELFNQVSVLDLTNYTKNVLLRDTDFMSMAHSLEVRVPYLDHPLVEWALRAPAGVKAGARKALLADAARPFLPDEIFERPKQGFVLPLARWMQGELRPEVDARLRRLTPPLAELLDSAAAASVWNAFLRSGRSWLRPWSLYALARWAESVRATP